MLAFAQLDRLVRLRRELRQVLRSKPKTRLIHLSPAGGASNVDQVIREKAVLMQQKLFFEMKYEKRNTPRQDSSWKITYEYGQPTIQ